MKHPVSKTRRFSMQFCKLVWDDDLCIFLFFIIMALGVLLIAGGISGMTAVSLLVIGSILAFLCAITGGTYWIAETGLSSSAYNDLNAAYRLVKNLSEFSKPTGESALKTMAAIAKKPGPEQIKASELYSIRYSLMDLAREDQQVQEELLKQSISHDTISDIESMTSALTQTRARLILDAKS